MHLYSLQNYVDIKLYLDKFQDLYLMIQIDFIAQVMSNNDKMTRNKNATLSMALSGLMIRSSRDFTFHF